MQDKPKPVIVRLTLISPGTVNAMAENRGGSCEIKMPGSDLQFTISFPSRKGAKEFLKELSAASLMDSRLETYEVKP